MSQVTQSRSVVSEHFVDMQNEIAQNFKNMVMMIYDNCESNLPRFMKVMRAIWLQYNEKKCDLVDLTFAKMTIPYSFVEEDAIYQSFMEFKVWHHSSHERLSLNITHDLRGWGFDFASLESAFRHYTKAALKQFIFGGTNVEEKVFRQLAIISITQEYKKNRIKLTLRQLYYQLVSKNYIKNQEAEYKKIIDLTGMMRERCILELDEFADNTRFAVRYNFETDPKQFALDAIDEYRYHRDGRESQPTYVEVWIEKEALRTVIKPITDREHVSLFICRGYPSTSALYDQAQAIIKKTKSDPTIDTIEILYFGDHDPSGLQIPEAIQEIFHKDYQLHHVRVVPCALTKDQIEQFDLPPNPAKLTDPRAASYVELHGEESWELDAVPPLELQHIVSRSIKDRTDQTIVLDVKRRQKEERREIEAVKTYIQDNWGYISTPEEEEDEDSEE